MNPLHDYLLEDHTADGNRSGEGAAVLLDDGSLYLVYGRFRGGGDFSPAELVCRRSRDGGKSWSAPETFFTPDPSWVNAMSVSLLRLHDGRLAALFLVKLSHDVCVPYWTISEDEAAHWSAPRRIIPNDGYYVVHNDRLVQLRDGRLLVPYAFSSRAANCGLPLSGCFLSDDRGESWRHSRQEILIEPENYHLPERVVPDATPVLRLFRQQQVCAQEPGVIELDSGDILMWARSNGGYAYAARSSDRGDHWSPYRRLCGTPMPNGPATIKRIPGTRRLAMLHSDRSGVPFGDPTFQWRTPLAVSISDDDGANWTPHEPLIRDASHNYCYYSMCFFDGKCLATTYQSSEETLEDGTQARHNLRSLRILVVDNAWW